MKNSGMCSTCQSENSCAYSLIFGACAGRPPGAGRHSGARPRRCAARAARSARFAAASPAATARLISRRTSQRAMAKRDAAGEQVQEAAPTAPSGGSIQRCSTRLDRIEQTRQEGDRRGLRAQPLADRLQLLQRVLVAVHAARAGAYRCSGRSRRCRRPAACEISATLLLVAPRLEVGVKQHQHRPDDAEHHVESRTRRGCRRASAATTTRLRAE